MSDPPRDLAAATSPWRERLAVAAFGAAGLAPDSAFQAWMVTVAALNYACAYLLFRVGIRSSRLASAAGHVCFVEGPPSPLPD